MQPGLRPRLIFRRSTAVPPERQLGREAVIALIAHGCFQLGASMSGLFLNLYLWRLTQDLVVNGMYNIVLYLVTPAAFAAGGWIAKRKDRMFTYRLGIFAIALFYLLVVIAQGKVAEWYIGFAVFNGVAAGFYWTGFLVLSYDVSTETNRIRFLAINMVVFNSAGLIGPALAGSIIQRSSGLQGYILIFAVASVMFLLAALISLRIPVIRSHHKAYYLHMMGLLMRKNRLWLQGLAGFFVLGAFQGMMLFLPNIMLFQAVGREDWVGYFGMMFSGLTVATGYVISRKASKEHVRRYVLLSSTGIAAGAFCLLIDTALWSVLLFMVVYSIMNPLAVNTLTSYYYRLTGRLPLKGQLRVEAVVMRELFLNTGRVLSIAALLVGAPDLQSAWLPAVLTVAALLQYALVFLLRDEREETAAADR
ncbi:MFS transporter [Paenibacillus cisolokensis]|uniref:MFS transporter n=1 Tax=Paenibacillus cisolokensis TaxID=1658519 RepID=UPI003D2C9EBF